jgi:CheY-like chemotaxis protein
MKRRLLLVGADSKDMATFRGFLEALDEHLHRGDYQIETIEYCDDALAVLRRRPFDLVLLLSLRAPWRTWASSDSLARLTCETGILFLTRMRTLRIEVPVLVISGSDEDVKDEALSAGAFAFIPKPPDLLELDRLVALALGNE